MLKKDRKSANPSLKNHGLDQSIHIIGCTKPSDDWQLIDYMWTPHRAFFSTNYTFTLVIIYSVIHFFYCSKWHDKLSKLDHEKLYSIN